MCICELFFDVLNKHFIVVKQSNAEFYKHSSAFTCSGELALTWTEYEVLQKQLASGKGE